MCHWRVKVKVLDVCAAHFGIGCGQDTVHQAFESGDVSCGGTGVARVINEIAPDGEAGAVDFLFLGAERTDETSIGDLAVCGDVGVGDERVGVGAFDAVANSLGTTSEFVGRGV